jgi:hypothetical protein
MQDAGASCSALHWKLQEQELQVRVVQLACKRVQETQFLQDHPVATLTQCMQPPL